MEISVGPPIIPSQFTRLAPPSRGKRRSTSLFLRVLCVLRGSAKRKFGVAGAPTLGFLRQPNLQFHRNLRPARVYVQPFRI